MKEKMLIQTCKFSFCTYLVNFLIHIYRVYVKLTELKSSIKTISKAYVRTPSMFGSGSYLKICILVKDIFSY